MDALRACACTTLEGTMGGSVSCSCALMPGVEAPADWCQCANGASCGMAWVRLDRMYESSQKFPSPDVSPQAGCAPVVAAVLEVGAYRCQPTVGGGGTPPSPAATTQAALVQADDAMALHRAIHCCAELTSRKYVIGAYTPRSGGGCGGGAWTVTVQLLRR